MGGSFDNLGWIEIVFVAIVALGIGFWQLWSVNREIAKDKEKSALSGKSTSGEAGQDGKS